MVVYSIFVLSAIFFGSSVSGLSVDSPASGSQLDVSRKTTVTWSSDNSDPSKFDLYLINDARFPSISFKIASEIDTSAGSYSFDGIDAIPGSGYRFDIKDTNDSDILAQSDQFVIVSKGSDTTVASAGSSSTATTTTATTTVDSGDTDSTTITSTSSDDGTVTESQVATTETTRTALISSSTSSSKYISLSSTPSSSSTDSAATTTPNSATSLTCRSPGPSVMGAVMALFAWMW
ncbi:Ser-Thr-rich glycosyl-phosphatidyl-inositol-anchored membrane family-domain-containing protein [Aspergillus californicus]